MVRSTDVTVGSVGHFSRIFAWVLVATLAQAGRQPVTAVDPHTAPGPRARGGIDGVVVDAVSLRPIAGAIVTLTPARAGLPPQVVSDDGMFRFHDLPPGDYGVSARAPGYFGGSLGRSTAFQGGVTLAVGEQVLTGVSVRLEPVAAIGGRVTDTYGDPVVGAHVRALAVTSIAGQMWLSTGVAVRTDDRGVFRLTDLRAGRYVVQVPFAAVAAAAGSDERLFRSPDRPVAPLDEEGRAQVYLTTYFPSATSIDTAGVVTVVTGEQKRGIEVVVSAAVPRRMAGRVAGASGGSEGLTLRLTPEGIETLGEQGIAAATRADRDGRFVFAAVPPGRYRIEVGDQSSRIERAMPSGRTGYVPLGPVDDTSGFISVLAAPRGTTLVQATHASSGVWARTPVVVGDADLDDVVVLTQPAGELTGLVVRDDERPIGPVVSVLLSPLTPGALALTSRSVPGGDRAAFRVTGVVPGRYALSVLGGTLRSIQCGARDLTDAAIEFPADGGLDACVITIAARPAAIEGRVSLEANAPADLGAIVFPVAKPMWALAGLRPARIRAVPVAADGRFRVPDLPAGEYFVTIVPGSQLDGWTDGDRLSAWAARATRIRLDWGETVAVPLTGKDVQ